MNCESSCQTASPVDCVKVVPERLLGVVNNSHTVCGDETRGKQLDHLGSVLERQVETRSS